MWLFCWNFSSAVSVSTSLAWAALPLLGDKLAGAVHFAQLAVGVLGDIKIEQSVRGSGGGFWAAGLGGDSENIGVTIFGDSEGRRADLLCDLLHERGGLQNFDLRVYGLLLTELKEGR